MFTSLGHFWNGIGVGSFVQIYTSLKKQKLLGTQRNMSPGQAIWFNNLEQMKEYSDRLRSNCGHMRLEDLTFTRLYPLHLARMA